MTQDLSDHLNAASVGVDVDSLCAVRDSLRVSHCFIFSAWNGKMDHPVLIGNFQQFDGSLDCCLDVLRRIRSWRAV